MGNAGFKNSYRGHASTPKGKLLKKLNERFEVKTIMFLLWLDGQ